MKSALAFSRLVPILCPYDYRKIVLPLFDSLCLLVLVALEMLLFPSIFFPLPFSLCMESTPYVFPFRMVFFYLTTTGWIVYFSLCENSIIQPNQIRIGSKNVVMCFRKTGCSLTGRGMVSQVLIPHVLLFYRCCLRRRRQQHCPEGRDRFCEQHIRLWRCN